MNQTDINIVARVFINLLHIGLYSVYFKIMWAYSAVAVQKNKAHVNLIGLASRCLMTSENSPLIGVTSDSVSGSLGDLSKTLLILNTWIRSSWYQQVYVTLITDFSCCCCSYFY